MPHYAPTEEMDAFDRHEERQRDIMKDFEGEKINHDECDRRIAQTWKDWEKWQRDRGHLVL